MQLDLGQKIRELRRRDGRTQEALAEAIGVTSQAVSRWEANGGYPDMGMIPVIANYFHITIDELFGYNNDRNKKIQEYSEKAKLLFHNGRDTECIALLRSCLAEFPDEISIKIQLAAALDRLGYQDGTIPNKYLEEAVSLYEEASAHDKSCLIPLLSLYSLLGEYDKAEALADRQQPVRISREVLLGQLPKEQKGQRYLGEAILTLLHELRYSLERAIAGHDGLVNSRQGIDISLAVRRLYENILDADCCGKFHSDLCMLDLSCVTIAGNIKDYEAALRYFDSAFIQYTKFMQWQKSNADRDIPPCSGKIFRFPDTYFNSRSKEDASRHGKRPLFTLMF